jgi:adhesin transport system outer membrane protein
MLMAAALVQGPAPNPAPLTQLPRPVADPLATKMSSDPVLALARGNVSEAEFTALVRGAVERYPGVGEAIAGIAEAEAGKDEARAGLFPTVDIGINSNRTIARSFEGGLFDNIVERSRPSGRTDATVSIEQTLFDFGATAARIAAAGARLRAASFQAEAAADRTALRAIAAWYDVFAYRALVTLGGAFAENQQELRGAVQERISLGVSAPGDLPRVESYIASSEADLARYRRLLANAEARFEEMFGVSPPPDLGRAPVIATPAITKDMAQLLARSSPEVESTEALARAARQDARAQRAQTWPQVRAGIDAGKYGFYERDYDIRGRVTLNHRIFGGVDARADQAEARAASADARAVRVRGEAEREAAIAWSDVHALEQQLAALESSYVSSRQSRDVLAERFRVARGTLFDLLESESAYFNVAASYIRAITELDAARYVLLSRTGQLLAALNIEPPSLEDQ